MLLRSIHHDALSLIKHHEGLRLEAYRDAAGFWTIGYGHLMSRDREWTPPESECLISEEQADDFLLADLKTACSSVLRLITIPLTEFRYGALVSFTFNLGGVALQASTLRRKVNAGLHPEVPTEFRKWVFAGGRKLPGLVRRRNDEADLYMRES